MKTTLPLISFLSFPRPSPSSEVQVLVSNKVFQHFFTEREAIQAWTLIPFFSQSPRHLFVLQASPAPVIGTSWKHFLIHR